MRRGFLAESPQKAIFTGCYVCIFQTDCCRRQELRRGADTTGMKHEPQSAEWSQAATQPCKEGVRSPDVPRRDVYEGAVLTTCAQRRRLMWTCQSCKGVCTQTNDAKANISAQARFACWNHFKAGLINIHAENCYCCLWLHH